MHVAKQRSGGGLSKPGTDVKRVRFAPAVVANVVGSYAMQCCRMRATPKKGNALRHGAMMPRSATSPTW